MATCEESATYYCSCICGDKGTFYFEYGTPNGHTPVIDPAIEATCTQSGLTEGSHCEVCSKTLVLQRETTKSHSFNNEIIHEDYLSQSATCETRAIYYLTCECGQYVTYGYDPSYANENYYRIYDNQFLGTLNKYYEVCTFTSGEPLGHSFKQQKYTTTNFYHSEQCDRCDYTQNEIYHSYDNDYHCDICLFNASTTKEMKYTLSEDGTYYILSGIGYATDTELIIPSKINNKPVKEIASKAFESNKNITAVWMPDSIEKINAGAFSQCSKLNTIYLNTKIKQIASSVFSGCTNLANINLENVEEIGSSAFSSCSKLSKIDTNNVKRIESSAFNGCSYLGNLNLNSVEYVGYLAFANCRSMTSIHLTEKTTYLGTACFMNCYVLSDLTLPFIQTYLGIYFDNTKTSSEANDKVPSSLKTVTVLGGHLVSAFCNCSYITNITIGQNVESINYATFNDCISLNSVLLPDVAIPINSNAFDNTAICNNTENWSGGLFCIDNYLIAGRETLVETITIPNNIKYIAESAFYNCKTLYGVICSNNIEYIGKRAFYNCIELQTFTFEENSKCSYIGEYAFYKCEQLTSIIIPSTVVQIEDSAFSSCTNLIIFCTQTIIPSEWGSSWNSSRQFYLYSENEPSIEGDYWHYVDGVPTIWNIE